MRCEHQLEQLCDRRDLKTVNIVVTHSHFVLPPEVFSNVEPNSKKSSSVSPVALYAGFIT